MPSIRITRFAGLIPSVDMKELPNDHAQIAHNCLLWNGWLSPMPQWEAVFTSSNNILSMYFDPVAPMYTGGNFSVDTDLVSAFRNQGEPFNTTDILGTFATFGFNPVRKATPSSYPPIRLGIPPPAPISVSQIVTPQNLSVYPISRTYAVTFLSNNMESAPYVFPQLGNVQSGGISIYEGDYVALGFDIDPAIVSLYDITGFRIYRTVPGFDTAEQVGNPTETAFHLVTEILNIPGPFVSVDPGNGFWAVNYIDAERSDQIRGDLLLSDQWMPPLNYTTFFLLRAPLFGQTEGGWAYSIQTDLTHSPTYVQISERYLYHAWPPQNFISIPDVIFGAASFYDNLFLGTSSKPYHVHIAETDGEALSIVVRPFPDTYLCMANSMTATNFGAMFVSKDANLIALSADSNTVASKRVASPGDDLITPAVTFKFSAVQSVGWWNGLFFVFTASGVAAVFNQPSPNNNEYPLGQLVTIDTPAPAPGPNIVTGQGFFASWANVAYKFALPGFDYENAPKANFTWKSKRYVMSGLTTFAAAKVVNDNSGTLAITINGYNAGGETVPSFTYSRALNHSNPFRIPHQHKCLEWEVVLQGTSVVQEFHLASSMRELTETPGA